MSGMYNVVFGRHPFAKGLLDLLHEADPGFEPGRVRDAWVEIEGDWVTIRVHTRNGGNNRSDDDIAAAIESMTSHPWFVRDEDLDFDSTYADFWFRPPHEEPLPGQYAGQMENLRVALTRLAEPPVDMNERWREAIANIGRTRG